MKLIDLHSPLGRIQPFVRDTRIRRMWHARFYVGRQCVEAAPDSGQAEFLFRVLVWVEP